jgi:glutathione S-transferase
VSQLFFVCTGIPHVIKEADHNEAPKSKVPYIKHDGHLLGDSQLIIRYLENTFNVSKMSYLGGVKNKNKNKHAFTPFAKLSATERAHSELIRILCEQDLYWGILSVKWGGKGGICRSESAWHNTVESSFQAIPAAMRGIITAMIRVVMLRDMWGQGLRRHSPDDQLYLMKRSVETLSTMLGSQTYMLGSFPSECDCIAFGTLDGLLDDSKWPNDLTNFITDSCPNLVRYHRAIRESVFGDMRVGDEMPAGVSDVKGCYNEH